MKKISYIATMQKCLLLFVVLNLFTALVFYFIKDGFEIKKQLASIPALLFFYYYLAFLKKINLRKARKAKLSI
ncbi:hypothetical protein [Pedobacter gandavensis]|uniref:Uncharacterized protein n=1 Tax=Pedobacter gandavensis TaxID=2679963 RepID=A0ABR6ESA3_9SPHI|nr:hypothetical protein [Pedobacter gandavensis]MBB2148140.1 hypothetical protein [Pedobacter gandavensis]